MELAGDWTGFVKVSISCNLLHDLEGSSRILKSQNHVAQGCWNAVFWKGLGAVGPSTDGVWKTSLALAVMSPGHERRDGGARQCRGCFLRSGVGARAPLKVKHGLSGNRSSGPKKEPLAWGIREDNQGEASRKSCCSWLSDFMWSRVPFQHHGCQEPLKNKNILYSMSCRS